MPYQNQFEREVECLTFAIEKTVYPDKRELDSFREAVNVLGFQNIQGIMTEFKLSFRENDDGDLILESQGSDKLASALNIEAFMNYVTIASYIGRAVY